MCPAVVVVGVVAFGEVTIACVWCGAVVVVVVVASSVAVL
jgi:hypothetical protein